MLVSLFVSEFVEAQLTRLCVRTVKLVVKSFFRIVSLFRPVWCVAEGPQSY